MAVAGPASAKIRAARVSETLHEIAAKGGHSVQEAAEDVEPWARSAAGVGRDAGRLASVLASRVPSREVVMQQHLTAPGALRAFNACHHVMRGTAGVMFTVYALYTVGVLLGPVVLVIGDAGNVVASWIWEDQSEYLHYRGTGDADAQSSRARPSSGQSTT